MAQKKSGVNEKEEPMKIDDDACVIGKTKILTFDGNKRIDQIKKGEYVYTRNGFKKVTKVHDNGFKKVREYNIDGNNIVCTPDHKIITVGGVKEIDTLTHCDTCYILTAKIYKEYLACKSKALFIKVLNSAGIRAQGEMRHTIAQEGSTSKKEFSICTDINTNKKRGPFPKEWLSTIKTIIHLITTLIILKLWMLVYTLLIIAKNIIKKTKKNVINICLQLDILLKHGINHLWGGHGTVSTQNKLAFSIAGCPSYANIAAQNIWGRSEKCNCFVATNAKRHGAEIREKMTSKNIVQSVGKNILPINTQQENIVALNVEKVYDLTIENEHEYYANNILLHNCDALRYLVMQIDGVEPRIRWI